MQRLQNDQIQNDISLFFAEIPVCEMHSFGQNKWNISWNLYDLMLPEYTFLDALQM